MNYLKKTIEYYSNWTDVSSNEFNREQFISKLSHKRLENLFPYISTKHKCVSRRIINMNKRSCK